MKEKKCYWLPVECGVRLRASRPATRPVWLARCVTRRERLARKHAAVAQYGQGHSGRSVRQVHTRQRLLRRHQRRTRCAQPQRAGAHGLAVAGQRNCHRARPCFVTDFSLNAPRARRPSRGLKGNGQATFAANQGARFGFDGFAAHRQRGDSEQPGKFVPVLHERLLVAANGPGGSAGRAISRPATARCRYNVCAKIEICICSIDMARGCFLFLANGCVENFTSAENFDTRVRF